MSEKAKSIPEEQERELLPCPFCGGEPQTDFIDSEASFLIECFGCDARGPICFEMRHAIDAWNRRASLAERQDSQALPEQPSDEHDARRFHYLCSHPDWAFIENLCRQFVAESQQEFYEALSQEIDRRATDAAEAVPALQRMGMDSKLLAASVHVAAPQKPLTVEQIKACEAVATKPLRTGDVWTPHQVRFVRAIEAAHGIGDQP